jgi:hypothetical protein
MAQPHTWTSEEELAFKTWELPESLREHAEYNLHQIEEYVRSQGYIIEHALLDMLVNVSSDLRPRLRFANPTTHSLGDALADALQARPEPEPEPLPQPYAGDIQHKLVEAGVGVTDQHMSAVEKKEAREQAKADFQQAIGEIRKGKQKLEEARAQAEAETLIVTHRTGIGIDQNLTSELRQIFAKFKETGEVCWVETLRQRNLALQNIEKSREAPPAPVVQEIYRPRIPRTRDEFFGGSFMH